MEAILKTKTRIFVMIFLLGMSVYFNALGNPFKTMDDFISIVANTQIRDFSHIGDFFTSSFFGGKTYYRPLVYVSFMMEYHFFNLRPFFYNLTNIVLHILTAMGVFILVSQILKNRVTGAVVAFLFVLHPVHAEAIGNIPGRSILLCTFFFVYSFVFYCRFLENQKGRMFAYFGAVLFFILSLFSKESAIMLPVVLFSYLYFFHRAEGIKINHWGTLIPFLILLVIYILIRQKLGITKVYYWPSFYEGALGVGTFLNICFHYFKILLLPYDLYYDHSTVLFQNFKDPMLLLTAFIWGVILFVIIGNRKKINSQSWFLISWIVINFIAVSQVVPIRTSATHVSSADHFLYLPSIGALALLVMSAQWLFDRAHKKGMVAQGFAQVFTVGICIFLFLVTFQQNVYTRDEITLFKRTLAHNPNNSRVRSTLATSYAKLGMFEEAEIHYREALKLDPWLVKAHIGLGTALAEQGQYWESIEAYEKAQDPGAFEEMLESNLQMSYRYIIDDYLARFPKEQDNPDLHYSLGVIYSKAGKMEEGIAYYKQALVLDPSHKNAIYNLASSFALLRKWEEAAHYYEQVLTLATVKDELDVLAYSNLGQIYNELGRGEQARQYFRLSEDLKESLKGERRD